MAYVTVNFHSIDRVRFVKQSHTNAQGDTTRWFEVHCDGTQLINIFAPNGKPEFPDIEIVEEEELVPLPAA